MEPKHDHRSSHNHQKERIGLLWHWNGLKNQHPKRIIFRLSNSWDTPPNERTIPKLLNIDGEKTRDNRKMKIDSLPTQKPTSPRVSASITSPWSRFDNLTMKLEVAAPSPIKTSNRTEHSPVRNPIPNTSICRKRSRRMKNISRGRKAPPLLAVTLAGS